METDSSQRCKGIGREATVATREISVWYKERKSTMRIVKILQQGTRAVAKSPVLETLKTQLDKSLGDLI